jgi:hypothetical protein
VWNKNIYRNLLGKPEGRRPLGRPRKKRKYNLKVYLKVIE